MDEDELRSAAEAIRADLPDLVGDPAERSVIDADLELALGLPPGSAREALRKALGSHAATREVMRRRTRGGFDRDRAVGSPGGVPGPLGPPGRAGVLFICPNQDFSFLRSTVADVVPPCPHDGAALVRQDR